MYYCNLQKPGDYAKAKMTQTQILNMKIANDMNISRARQLVTLQLPPEELPADDGLTTDEIQQNVALQESDCIKNLLLLGFKYADVQTIVAQLSADDRLMFNSTYPAISTNIKSQYNVKLMSATSFIEYLQQYFTELNNSKGLGALTSSFITNKFNVLIDSVADLQNIIPTSGQFSFLRRTMLDIQRSLTPGGQAHYQPVLERLIQLERHIPSDAVMQDINTQLGAGGNSVQAFQMMQNIQTALADIPTKDQFEDVLNEIQDGNITADEKLKSIEILISGLTDANIKMLESFDMNPLTPRLDKGSSGASLPTPFGTIWIVEGNKIRNVDDKGVKTKVTIAMIKEGAKHAKDTQNQSEIDFYSNLPKSIAEIIKYIEAQDAGGKVPPTVNLKSASGLKVGTGINYTQEPKYKTFGKYIINWNKLVKDDILCVKYKSGGTIPHYKPTRITDKFQDFLVDFVEFC